MPEATDEPVIRLARPFLGSRTTALLLVTFATAADYLQDFGWLARTTTITQFSHILSSQFPTKNDLFISSYQRAE
jgi:hypothetical protein